MAMFPVDVSELKLTVNSINELSDLEMDIIEKAMIIVLQDIRETRLHVHNNVLVPVTLDDLPYPERQLARRHLYGETETVV